MFVLLFITATKESFENKNKSGGKGRFKSFYCLSIPVESNVYRRAEKTRCKITCPVSKFVPTFCSQTVKEQTYRLNILNTGLRNCTNQLAAVINMKLITIYLFIYYPFSVQHTMVQGELITMITQTTTTITIENTFWDTIIE